MIQNLEKKLEKNVEDVDQKVANTGDLLKKTDLKTKITEIYYHS